MNKGFNAIDVNKEFYLLNKQDIEGEILKYFDECITYWRDWQKVDDKLSDAYVMAKISKEYTKNGMELFTPNTAKQNGHYVAI